MQKQIIGIDKQTAKQHRIQKKSRYLKKISGQLSSSSDYRAFIEIKNSSLDMVLDMRSLKNSMDSTGVISER
ncbi:hypothetical protein LX69_02930 [Breznakibacter xylanolyticus]|uniref:Uncharacterized protein n=1 Tax=Breznakibacter xylanolyticus TaxID=990 RepID=A0A2W7PSC3_9BACT|nr:hypothetical protein LX69_02930 [Breznakibacter xylanolyticus]